jgi:predicted phosphodiesterase
MELFEGLKELKETRLIAVFRDPDDERIKKDFPETEKFKCGARRFLLSHRGYLKSFDDPRYKAGMGWMFHFRHIHHFLVKKMGRCLQGAPLPRLSMASRASIEVIRKLICA